MIYKFVNRVGCAKADAFSYSERGNYSRCGARFSLISSINCSSCWSYNVRRRVSMAQATFYNEFYNSASIR